MKSILLVFNAAFATATLDIPSGEEGIKGLSAGGRHTCAVLKSSSTLRCWGWNGYGQLGLGDSGNRGDKVNDMGANLARVELGYNTKIYSISTGSSHTCAILDDKSLKCWGWNKYGQAGIGKRDENVGDGPMEMGDELRPLNAALGTKGEIKRRIIVKAVSAGHSQSCVVQGDDSLNCWGRLLLEDVIRNADPVENVKQAAVGDLHACAIFMDDLVRCWGTNQYGQLGTGDTYSRTVPDSSVTEPWAAVELGENRTCKYVAVGYGHTCVILDDDSLKCWGWGYDGQLGYENSENIGDYLHQMGDILPAVDVGTDLSVKDISLGFYHTCAILSNNSLKCWGFNSYGQLGYGDAKNRGLEQDEMGDDLKEVDLGPAASLQMITAGFAHTCVVVDYQYVKCWGLNDYGQLGLGDTRSRGLNDLDMQTLAYVQLSELAPNDLPEDATLPLIATDIPTPIPQASAAATYTFYWHYCLITMLCLLRQR